MALADASATMTRVLAALEDYGVEKADVQTTGLSMNPVYDYHEYGPPIAASATGSPRRRTVTVPELRNGRRGDHRRGRRRRQRRAGRATSGSRSATRTPCSSEAREAAVEEATTKAEQYAEATGQALGDVLSLREVSPATRRDRSYSPSDAELRTTADQSAVPIRAGEDELKVTVRHRLGVQLTGRCGATGSADWT